MDRRALPPARLGAVLRNVGRRLHHLPRGVRMVLIAAALLVGFAAVVLPLFTFGGGAPRAEVAGFLPSAVVTGQRVRADIAIDNTGEASIYPVCVAMSGPGTRLLSANFQGLDQVTASDNLACGGQLASQQTISVTIVFSVDVPGRLTVSITPQQRGTKLGAPLTTTVTAS